MWQLLTTAFGHQDLKRKSKESKIEFVKKRKIDFIDIISKVKVDMENESNYSDKYLDKHVFEWRNVIAELKKLSQLKRVGFTRKTYTDIPQMKNKIIEIENYCIERNILFKWLISPARYYNLHKQDEWTKFLKSNIFKE